MASHLGVVVVGLLHWEGPEVILGHEEPHALHHRSAHAANLRLEGDLELVRARLVPKQQACRVSDSTHTCKLGIRNRRRILLLRARSQPLRSSSLSTVVIC